MSDKGIKIDPKETEKFHWNDSEDKNDVKTILEDAMEKAYETFVLFLERKGIHLEFDDKRIYVDDIEKRRTYDIIMEVERAERYEPDVLAEIKRDSAMDETEYVEQKD